MKSNAIAQPAQGSLPSNVNAAVNTAQVFPAGSSATQACVVAVESASMVEQREIQVIGSGYLTTAGAYTALITLYGAVAVPGTPLTAANWTIIGAGTARAIGTTSCPFLYRASLIADAVSGKLQGTFAVMVNNLYDGAAAISNVITAVNLAGTGDPALVFAIGVTFNTANAANIGHLHNFYVAA